MSNKIFVTGSAGFIGFHLTKMLLNNGFKVIGIDNLNDYYDLNLKIARLNILKDEPDFVFYENDIEDIDILNKIFVEHSIEYVVNLAAQAGVRYSLKNPTAYIKSNINGFFSILEICRKYKIKHLIYASSSSVYGGNKIIPFSTSHNVDHPVSLYAATKKSNELMAHSYSDLYDIPTTGLRFFTVYGPWGRPDMAYYTFTKLIIEGKAIQIFNNGKMERDFTYIDDIVEAIFRLLPKIPKRNDMWNENNCKLSDSFAPYKIYNVGNSKPIKLEYFISVLEESIGKKAIKEYFPVQKGDVLRTYADVSGLQKDIEFKPFISIEKGLANFVNWYKEYYKVG